ncbi:MAG: ABC transporter permease [Hyphomicrobiales bacterium]|nr:ABC transporter permease [Hyphomicrobiales bacterium]MCP5372200.1 ABC transporter permease [Hyphomicrobiales bacterium]
MGKLSRFLPAAYFWLVILYLLFPIVIVLPISFSNNPFLRFPPSNFGVLWYETYFSDPVWVAATVLSFKVALTASLLATVIGTMAVLVLERRQVPLKAAVTYFITSPIIIPHIFIALGVFILAVRLGLEDNALTLAGAHATIAIPFVVLIVGAAHRQLDPTFERAARVLGAGPVRAFFSAAFPSLLPGIAAAAVFAFFVSFDELIIAEFLMGEQETLPMRIWADLRLELRPTIAAVSSLLITITTLGMALSEILRRRGANLNDD